MASDKMINDQASLPLLEVEEGSAGSYLRLTDDLPKSFAVILGFIGIFIIGFSALWIVTSLDFGDEEASLVINLISWLFTALGLIPSLAGLACLLFAGLSCWGISRSELCALRVTNSVFAMP